MNESLVIFTSYTPPASWYLGLVGAIVGIGLCFFFMFLIVDIADRVIYK